MEFRLIEADHELLLPLAKRLPLEIESMIQTGVLRISTDKEMKLIQHAVVLRSDMLMAMRKYKESRKHLSLAIRIKDMRIKLLNNMKKDQQDLAEQQPQK